MKNQRSCVLAGLMLVVALLIVGCGGGKPFSEATGPSSPVGPGSITASTPQARLLASVQRATEAKTARLAMDMSISGLGTGGDLAFAGTGRIDLTNRRLQMTLRSVGSTPSISIETRVVDGIAYVNTGDGWMSQPVSATGTDLPMPGNALDYLQGISGDVHVEGHETLHGDDTTRYAATLDLGRALTRIHDAGRRAIVKHALDQLGVAKFPAQVWVDDHGRLRKLRLSIDLAAAARFGAPAGRDSKIVESVELYDFGVRVDVQAPANAEPVVAVAAAGHDAQADLRNALTAEKARYTDVQAYTASVSSLTQIESTLDWGGKLSVFVGGSRGAANQVVCISETANGVAYTIADVASGPRAGTYYGGRGCPRVADALTVSSLGSRW